MLVAEPLTPQVHHLISGRSVSWNVAIELPKKNGTQIACYYWSEYAALRHAN